jgi:integrase
MARGSIIKRENRDGSVTHYVKFRAADGTQIKRAVGKSLREAEDVLATELAAVARGERRAVSRDTFEEAAKRWLERKRPRLEVSTIRNYERDLRLRLIPAFGPLRLRDITRDRIETYLADLDRAGDLSRKSINDSLIPLKGVLGRAVRDGEIPANPALDLDRDEPLKLPREAPSMLYLNRDDVHLYLAACPDWYRPLAEVLVGTGVRLGEALALEWRDVDWDTPALRVERAVKVATRQVGTTKSDKGRTVLLDGFVAAILKEQRERQKDDHWLGRLVFPSRAGTHLAHGAVWRHGHAVAVRRSGVVPKLRIHDLRHTAATLWLGAGESIYFVQQQLGHADIRTTISTYGHRDQQAHAAAAERAAAWWRIESGTTAGTTTPISAGLPR